MRNPRNYNSNLNNKTTFKPSSSTIISKENATRTTQRVEKYPIEKRLQILDNVGININNNASIPIIYEGNNNVRSRHLSGQYIFHNNAPSVCINGSNNNSRNSSITSEVRRKSQVGLAGTARDSFLSGISTP
jgi:hypothetical protein